MKVAVEYSIAIGKAFDPEVGERVDQPWQIGRCGDVVDSDVLTCGDRRCVGQIERPRSVDPVENQSETISDSDEIMDGW